ncbi:MAG: membrane integrity-associated transporter subunit PqiC, partial [Deltaproteobacteria bacterium]|nr:membrane integrity-associated transporter subunit PqiC [Deltaproteobacteria bacterium]
MSAPRILTLAAMLLSLAACPKAQTRHYYSLTFPPGSASFTAPFPYTVRVKDFGISATYNGDQLVYREDVHEIEYAKERRWTERPPRMVADLVRKYLRQSGLVAQVIDKYGERPPDFVLEGDIDAIEELISGEEGFAHLAVSLRLVRFESDTVVWRRSFDERRKVPSGKARATVRALSEILEEQLSRSVDELGRYLDEAARAPASPAPPSSAPKADAAPRPEPVPAVANPALGILRPEPPGSALGQHPQLVRDESDMPAGMGAVFFPSLSEDGEREPPLALYRDGDLAAQ